ncbi:MAG TPA: nitroreductase family protein [Ignavibacteriaceae bacterium]|nr:nitroreductase family protein [Ignavibacteriaceae bacterium]
MNRLILKRKSIKKYSHIAVEDEKIQLLFKAASLAPSSYNAQPWSFIMSKSSDSQNFNNLLLLMNEKNKEWAKNAPLIVLAVAKKDLTINNKPNKYFFYDVSSAVANLTYQALSMDLFVHQIGGFDSVRAKTDLNIPDEYDPVVMLVIGYNAEEAGDIYTQNKIRKPLSDFVFEKKFGIPAEINNEVLIN